MALIMGGVLLVYLVFRFYLLNKLGGRAKYLSLTLSEFLQRRGDCDDKGKDEYDEDVKF